MRSPPRRRFRLASLPSVSSVHPFDFEFISRVLQSPQQDHAIGASDLTRRSYPSAVDAGLLIPESQQLASAASPPVIQPVIFHSSVLQGRAFHLLNAPSLAHCE